MTTRDLTAETTGTGLASNIAAERRDGEVEALTRLARLHSRFVNPKRPDEVLQGVCELAHELSRGLYAALAITDEHDKTEGFFTSGLGELELKGLRVPPSGHGPLGSLRSDGRPVRIDDLDAHPKAFGFPPKHPVMARMLGVPIWANGTVRGSMYVTDRSDGLPFDDDDERTLVTLARHASYIVENFWF